MAEPTAQGGTKFPPDPDFAAKAHVKSFDEYEKMYKESIENPEKFWGEIAESFYWEKKWDTVREYEWGDNVDTKWYLGSKTNISYNCLDRHLDTRGDQTAIIWEGNEPGEDAKITYKELHEQVCKFANALKSLGVQKGDRVCLYMQMIPQLPVAMLACTASEPSIRWSSGHFRRIRSATGSTTRNARSWSRRIPRCAAPRTPFP